MIARPALSVITVVLLVAGVGLGQDAGAGPPDQTFDVRVKAGHVSVRADGARLVDVLEALGREAQIRVVFHGAINTPVTENFRSLSVDEAVRRLSRWHSVVLIYESASDDAGRSVLTEMRIASSQPDGAEASPRSGDANVRSDARIPPDWELWAKTLIAFKDANPETRSQQIEALVRAQGEEAIVTALREVATRNPDSRVRRGAVQVLGHMGSVQAVAAIQTTLNDENPGVRNQARTVLRRLNHARSSGGAVE